jgi:hypothetical protein
MKAKVLPLLSLLMFAGAVSAQTTSTYSGVAGTISPGNAFVIDFSPQVCNPACSYPYQFSDDGRGFGGPDCYYGSCVQNFSNYPLSYALPDGTTAQFSNFAGTANFIVQSDVTVIGTASGTDSTGTPVSVSVNVQWTAVCRSGRGGGCTKKFLAGTLNVTK